MAESQKTSSGSPSEHHVHLTSDDTLPIPESLSPAKVIARCHCGHVNVELPSPPSKTNECRCSICYRYGALWSYYRPDDVNIFVNIMTPSTQSDPRTQTGQTTSDSAGAGAGAGATSGLRSYVREEGNGYLAFYFCGHCGCLTHWAPTEKWLVFLRDEAEKKGADAAKPRVGINSRMLPPSLLEHVEKKVGQFEDFW